MIRTTTSLLSKTVRFQNHQLHNISKSFSTLKDNYDHLLVSREYQEDKQNRQGVGCIKLNRPKTMNALCDALFDDLIHAATSLNDDDSIGCLIISSSSQKAFAAGADISEMSQQQFSNVYKKNMFAQWANITKISKPIIAAVNGYALGGGCELAMMCDIILAGDKAKFGQPEINLGVIPGAGGTQRLTHAVGKSKCMELCLTGSNFLNANQAQQYGLVSTVHAPDELYDKALEMAFVISSKSGMASRMCKEAVNSAYELNLQNGLQFERRLFHSLFATNDQKEGMAAFLKKRKPDFTDS